MSWYQGFLVWFSRDAKRKATIHFGVPLKRQTHVSLSLSLSLSLPLSPVSTETAQAEHAVVQAQLVLEFLKRRAGCVAVAEIAVLCARIGLT